MERNIKTKKHVFSKSTNTLCICIMLVLCVFQNPIETVVPVFSFYDELLSILGFIFFLRNFKRIVKHAKAIIIPLFIFVIIGLISSFFSHLQPLYVVMYDVFLNFKFYFAIILGTELTVYVKRKTICRLLNGIVLLLFLLTIISYCTNIFSQGGYRYGIKVLCLFYTHPTCLASVCITILAYLYLFESNRRRLTISSIALLIMMSLTMRIKAIATACIIIFLLTAKSKRTNSKKSQICKIGIGIFIAIIFGWDQFSNYFLQSNSTARAILLTTSIKIANDFMPLGSGFGTFGSYISALYYSDIYYQYGISEIYGISKLNPIFISDTFYPMILAQTGWIGFLLYVCALYNLFMFFRKVCQNSIYENAFIFPFLYLLICSVAESAFVNSLAIPMAIAMGYTYKKSMEERNA